MQSSYGVGKSVVSVQVVGQVPESHPDLHQSQSLSHPLNWWSLSVSPIQSRRVHLLVVVQPLVQSPVRSLVMQSPAVVLV